MDLPKWKWWLGFSLCLRCRLEILGVGPNVLLLVSIPGAHTVFIGFGLTPLQVRKDGSCATVCSDEKSVLTWPGTRLQIKEWRERERERERQTDRQTDRQRETHRETERERDRETDRQTERDTQRDIYTERQRETERQRARLSRLATRYVHIVPHYRTPLSYPTIRSWFAGCRVYLHFTIRDKGLVSSQLLSAVWPGKQTVSRRSTSHVCLYTTPGRSYLYVRYKTALRLSIILKRDSGCMWHTKRTFLRL